MRNDTTFVGLDVHKDSIAVAVLLPTRAEPLQWTMSARSTTASRLIRRLVKEGAGHVVFCYEAGPCGYVLQRQFAGKGADCKVVAPSLIPVKPGDRIKTDRRDALKLAIQLRAGGLTEVHAPSEDEEAVRDLCRCRDDAKDDLQRARHRLSKYLLRHGRVFRVTKNWTLAHQKWMTEEVRFDHPAGQATFEAYIENVRLQQERVGVLTKQLEAVAQTEPYLERAGWLRCFRGIDTVTAMTILAEIHDFRRFPTARNLMSYLGLTPSEHSSGTKSSRGAITKAGNGHVRRALIEAAWHYRHQPRTRGKLKKRRRDQPQNVIALADRAQRRLYRRYWQLLAGSNKPSQKAVTAVARELVGFIWALLAQPESFKARTA